MKKRFEHLSLYRETGRCRGNFQRDIISTRLRPERFFNTG